MLGIMVRMLSFSTPTVYPSGPARFTRSAPMLPAAPGWFSTTICLPRLSLILLATMRTITSTALPACSGITNSSGLAGYSCAPAIEAAKNAAMAMKNRFVISTPRNRALRQTLNIPIDVSGPRHPDPVAVPDDVLDHLAKAPQPVRLAEDEAVQYHAHHQRPSLGFLQHLVEVVDEVLAIELGRRAAGD